MKLTVRYLCAPGQRLSGQHATSRDSPRLVFLFKSLGCSREQIEAQHRAGAIVTRQTALQRSRLKV